MCRTKPAPFISDPGNLRIKFAPPDGSGASLRGERACPGDFAPNLCEPLHKRMSMLMAAFIVARCRAADSPVAIGGTAMRPTTFADFVIVALATPCLVLVVSSYVLLAAALIENVREKFKLVPSRVRRHAPFGR
jgi:hypothetical protein